MDQRLEDLADQIEALRADLLAQLELLAWSSPGVTLLGEPATEYVVDLATPDEDYD